jgi:hypothetical protein
LDQNLETHTIRDRYGDSHGTIEVVPAEAVLALLAGKVLCDADEITRYKALAGELAEAAKLAESALAFIYGGEPLDPSGAIAAMRTALAKYDCLLQEQQ